MYRKALIDKTFSPLFVSEQVYYRLWPWFLVKKQPSCVCVCGESHPVSKRYLILPDVLRRLIVFQKSRGQRCPCHFLCQRRWVTCGKDMNQGRLIYVPANGYLLFRKAVLGLHFNLRLGFSAMARGSAKNPNHVFSISDLVTRRKVFLEFHFQMSLNWQERQTNPVGQSGLHTMFGLSSVCMCACDP